MLREPGPGISCDHRCLGLFCGGSGDKTLDYEGTLRTVPHRRQNLFALDLLVVVVGLEFADLLDQGQQGFGGLEVGVFGHVKGDLTRRDVFENLFLEVRVSRCQMRGELSSQSIRLVLIDLFGLLVELDLLEVSHLVPVKDDSVEDEKTDEEEHEDEAPDCPDSPLRIGGFLSGG